MKLYIKQKVFSWGDRFFVKDQMGRDKYMVRGEVFSWGKKLHVCHMDGSEAAFIKQKLLTWLPRYEVYQGERLAAEVKKEFTLFFPRYTIAGLGWEIEGSFGAHDYRITRGGQTIVTIRKEWMSWGDSYELDIADPASEILALAVVLIIDCVMDSDSGVSVSVGSN